MGLRESKKAELRKRILAESIELFRTRGYRATSVHAIAEQLQISEATFFNYFPSKDSLLDAWTDRLLRRGLAEAAGSSPGRTPRRQLRDLVRIVSPGIAEDRDFAQLAFSRARLCVEGGPPRPLAAVELFREGQRLGEIRADIAPEQLAELLAAAFRTAVAAWLHRPDEDPAALSSQLMAALDLLLDGCQKRHQRVRPPPPASGRAPAACPETPTRTHQPGPNPS